MLILIVIFYFSLFICNKTDDPNRVPTKCEVCKLLAKELTDNLQQHNSPAAIDIGYSLDDGPKKKTKYADSYVRHINLKSSFDNCLFKRNTSD